MITSHLRRWAGSTGLVCVASLITLALASSADALPVNGTQEFVDGLLQACPQTTGHPGPGVFGPARQCDVKEVLGDTFAAAPEHQASATDYNCATTPQTYDITWTSTTGSSNSTGMELSFATEEDLGPVKLKQEIKLKYDHTWSQSSSISQRTTVVVPPYSKGWIGYAPVMETVHASYDVTFRNKVEGHWTWFPDDFVTTQAVDDSGNPRGDVTQHTSLMSPDEWHAHCSQYTVPRVQLRNSWFEAHRGEATNCAGYSAAASDQVTMTGCGSTSLWEQFTVGTDGAVNTYVFYDPAVHRCLDTQHGYQTAASPGMAVNAYACDPNSPSQRWRAVPQPDGSMHLVNQQSALCADAFTTDRVLRLQQCVSFAENERWLLQN